MVMSSRTVMVPAVRKTTMRGPEASAQALRLPLPELFRFVTSQMRPPRPPRVEAPKPSAVGNALTSPLGSELSSAGVSLSESLEGFWDCMDVGLQADGAKEAAPSANTAMRDIRRFTSSPYNARRHDFSHLRRTRPTQTNALVRTTEGAVGLAPNDFRLCGMTVPPLSFDELVPTTRPVAH